MAVAVHDDTGGGTLPEAADPETALAALGIGNPQLEVYGERSELASWSGDIRGNAVNIIVDGVGTGHQEARVMLDDFAFEGVGKQHLGALPHNVFTGAAQVTRSRFLWSKGLVLEVRIDSRTYSADTAGDSAESLAPWARPLLTES
ncbi:hypothetical protein ACIQXD_35160 [Streptomyces uncialis]|uniref:hypothetical protein n=1 Tax=Streptomyces uncialis TaxID=1048205 RepID=UPI0037FB2334